MVSKTANYTVAASDTHVNVDATAGVITITLPAAASSSGQRVVVTKTDASVNSVIVDANGSELIAGSLTLTLFTQYQSLVLICDGSGWLVEGGLPRKQLIQTLVASSSATLDFAIGIDSAFNSYEFVLSNVIPATDASSLYVRTSSNAGSSYDAGASDYHFIGAAYNSSGVSAIGNSTGAAFGYIAGTSGVYSVDNASTSGVSGVMHVTNPSSTAAYKLLMTDTNYVGDGGTINRFIGSTHRRSTSAINAIRFLFSSGNIASGSISLYGIR